MKIRMIITLFLLLLLTTNVNAESYYYIGIGLGNNTNLTGASIEWEDGGGIGGILTAGYVTQLNDINMFKSVSDCIYLTGQWFHASQLDKGPPFDNTDESSLDHLGVMVSYRFGGSQKRC